MAPKKNPSTIPESSSSEATSASPAFISGVGVKEFVAVFGSWVERFAASGIPFQLCKDLISFVNGHCILGCRYLEQKTYQLYKYELHPIQAPIPICCLEKG